MEIVVLTRDEFSMLFPTTAFRFTQIDGVHFNAGSVIYGDTIYILYDDIDPLAPNWISLISKYMEIKSSVNGEYYGVDLLTSAVIDQNNKVMTCGYKTRSHVDSNKIVYGEDSHMTQTYIRAFTSRSEDYFVIPISGDPQFVAICRNMFDRNGNLKKA